jgi:hypothetical protein
MPYSWSISAGALPTGLTLASNTGTFSGTPTVAGSFPFTAQVTDSANHQATQMLTLNIEGVILLTCNACQTSPQNPPPLPYGTEGVPYPPPGTVSPMFTATGGVGPYTWCVVELGGACDNGSQGALPVGMTINPTTGDISGTPTSQPAAPLVVTVQARDSESPAASGNMQVTLTIFSIVTSTLANGFTNQMYSSSVVAAGGAGTSAHPYMWHVTDGNLPPGLNLCTSTSNPSCAITGTPTQTGTFTFTVAVTDGENPPAMTSKSLSIVVYGSMLTVSTTVMPPGNVGMSYPSTLHANGGIPPLMWCIKESDGTCDDGTTGALPPGLTLNTSTGAISGMPTMTGQSAFKAQVTDSENPPQVVTSGTLNVVVNGAIDNSLLNGHFALAISGFSNGSPYIMAGSFAADGNGNITSGKLDVNYGQGEPNNPQGCLTNPNCPQAEVMQPGSVYDLSSGNGQGTLHVTTLDFFGTQHTYVFSIAVSPKACVASPALTSCGRIIQRDPGNPQMFGSGVLKVQDSAFFTIGSFFPGNFALTASGINPAGTRYTAVGAVGTNPRTLVDIDCNGNNWGLPGCPLDINNNGAVGSAGFLGQFASQLDANNGRGDFLNITFQNPPDGYCVRTQGQFNACGYAYYVVNKQEMIIISTDPLTRPANMTLWLAYRQRSFGTGWTNAQLLGPMIVDLTGKDTGNADVTAGILSAMPDQGDMTMGTGTFSSDENDNGTLTMQSTQGTYAVDPTSGNKTGRFTLSFPQFGANGAIAYLYTGDFGYLMGTDPKGSTGSIQQQTGTSFGLASVIGALEGGTEWPAVSGVTNSVAWMFADGSGDIAAEQFTSGAGGPGGPNNLTLTYSVDATGRSIVMQNGTEVGVMYVIGPTKFVLLPTGGNPALSVFITGQPD